MAWYLFDIVLAKGKDLFSDHWCALVGSGSMHEHDATINARGNIILSQLLDTSEIDKIANSHIL